MKSNEEIGVAHAPEKEKINSKIRWWGAGAILSLVAGLILFYVDFYVGLSFNLKIAGGLIGGVAFLVALIKTLYFWAILPKKEKDNVF
ncbi:MAG: hypothetical protein JW812_00835 [Alphaproteobacteria bacterium]|nr:hypothetical protein [Alphaproteobacteria bacterium]MBN2779641.1 hypothetical protein [Alphaproteobacteria bacterium]